MSHIAKYLEHYGDPAIASFSIEGVYENAIVVPVLRESDNIEACLNHLARAATSQGPPSLAILVVNSDESHSFEWKADNAKVLERFSVRENHSLTVWTPALTVLCLDYSSLGRELPPKSGVGLARKIGCDIAVAFHAKGIIRSPWIRTTDADARVAADYLDPINERAVGAHYRYEHVGQDGDEAVTLYERYLHYYEAGLQYAQSPYAFSTIGSCFAFQAESYAQVRGFPRREAGEDFYFFNKLRKLGPIITLDRAPIRLMTRHDVRVPFGTTKSQIQIRETLARGEPYRVYDFKVFEELKRLLESMATFTEERSIPLFLGRLSNESRQAFLSLAGHPALENALSQRPSPKALAKHLEDWFDGFRTLKYVHFLTEHYYPKVEMKR